MSEPHLHLQLQLDRGSFDLDVDLQLPGRGITVLFGASGSGKTTVLRCVAGLERHVCGHIQIGGQVWLSREPRYRKPVHERALGYVFQEASLFAHLNVRQNIEFGLRRIGQAGTPQRLNDAVELLGISHLLSRSIDGLSGGERQRVAIARALATQPQVLLLDEPLSALDPSRKRDVFPWLERLRDELRIPMMYVTHSVDELTRLGDYLVVLDQGRVLRSGPLIETMSALDAQGMPGQDVGVLMEGRVEAVVPEWHLARVQLSGGSLWVRDDGAPAGQRVRLRVLARDVSLTLEEPQKTSIQNHVRVTIESAQDDVHPAQCLVRMRFGADVLTARITRRAWSQLGLQPGQDVWAQVKSVAVVH